MGKLRKREIKFSHSPTAGDSEIQTHVLLPQKHFVYAF